MTDIFSFNESNYLGKHDLEDAGDPLGVNVTVEKLEAHEMRDGSNKLVCYFKEFEKPLILNKSNRTALADVSGTVEIEEMPGTEINLWHNPDIEFKGERVGGLRLRAIRKPKRRGPSDRRGTDQSSQDPDDDIPW